MNFSHAMRKEKTKEKTFWHTAFKKCPFKNFDENFSIFLAQRSFAGHHGRSVTAVDLVLNFEDIQLHIYYICMIKSAEMLMQNYV